MSGVSAALAPTNMALINSAQSETNIDRLKTAAAKPGSTLSAADLKKIDKTAQDFEAVFITEMLKPMFESTDVDSTFGGGRGEEVFKGLTLNEYGKKLSGVGGIGIAKHIREELIRLQEYSQKGQQNAAALASAPAS